MIPVPLLLVLALLSASAPFATDMYLPVLPELAAEFAATTATAQLTLSGFFVGMGVGQLLIGPLSDALGRKRLLLCGALLAVGASVLAATAPSIAVLIAARVLQGLGGGACSVLARAIVSDLAEGRAAAKTFSLLMAIGALAPAIAPVVGGLLAVPLGWRGIYWVLVGLHAVQLILAFILVPSTGGRAATGGLARRVVRGYLTVLRTARFWGFLAAMAFSFAALFCYISSSPFVIQKVLGFSPAGYSLVFAVNSLGLFCGSVINSRLVDVYGPARLLRFGVGGQFIASVALLFAALADAPSFIILPLLFVCTVPVGFAMGNATALATGLLRSHAGSVSAVMGFVQSLLGAFVSPLMGLGTHPAVTMALGMSVCACCGAVGAFAATRQPSRSHSHA